MNRVALKSKNLHKGDRMNWEPISSVKPVAITSDMVIGKRLSDEDLRRNANNRTNYRIP
jgi:hypothetical protein